METTTLTGDKVDIITHATCSIEKIIYYCGRCGHTQDELLTITRNNIKEIYCIECNERVRVRRKNGRNQRTNK